MLLKIRTKWNKTLNLGAFIAKGSGKFWGEG